MKLNFRDLKQDKFTVDAEPTDTIAQLKEKVQAEKGWDASSQKLIYSGKILQDSQTVEFYKIEEKGFIVCMIQKPKPAAASSSAAAAPAPATPAAKPVSTPAAPPAPAGGSTGLAAAAAVPGTPTPVPQQGTTASARSYNDPNAFVRGSDHEDAIANMESMGFERADIDRAMRAAYNNPDRAVEYLLSGIPPSADRAPPPSTAQMPPTSPPAAGAPAATSPDPAGDEPVNLFDAAAAQSRNPGASPGLGGLRAPAAAGDAGAAAAAAGGAGSLEFLRNQPQFQQLRQLVQQRPQMLQSIMEQLNQANPQLAEQIISNPDEFMNLLAEENEEDAPIPPGANVVAVTLEERDAIERLTRLGFRFDQAMQAYFACDKNEELAANFLFDQPDEDEE